MIKAVFFDIDGTIVSYKTHKILEEDRLSLVKLQKNGIKVFLATGRHIKVIDNAVFPIDGIISCNGAMAHISRDGQQHSIKDVEMFKNIYSNPFPREIAIRLSRIVVENGMNTFVFPKGDPFISGMDERVQKVIDLLNFQPLPVKDVVEASLNEEFFECSPAVLEDKQYIFDPILKDIFLARSCPEFIDINPLGTSKGTGIEKVAEYMGWSIDEVAAFGDGANDAPMIAAAGTGIAMGNAVPAAKAVADIITDDVDDGGVTKALQKLGLI